MAATATRRRPRHSRVTWRGFTARYTKAEQKIMADLKAAGCPADELAFLHEAKARFKGRLR